MKTSDEKYEELIRALRSARPSQVPISEIEDSVMKVISEKKEKTGEKKNVLDFIFAWIWIGWVRKSLITASFCLIGYFIWQQHSILSKIENLQVQIRQNDRIFSYDPSFSTGRRLLLNRISEKNNISGEITVSREDLSKLIDSLQSVQSQYRDILEIIENDPVLKRAVQEKLQKNTRQGLNL